MKKVSLKNKTFRQFLSQENIKLKVSDLALLINTDYKGKLPLFLVTLKGAVFFGTDLLREIKIDCDIDFLTASSYYNEMESSGDLKYKLPEIDFNDRNILIIEDIVDTGNTYIKLRSILSEKGAKAIDIVTLLLKPENLKYDIDIKYKGFLIPNNFVIGYGMDFGQKGRNLPEIYSLTDD